MKDDVRWQQRFANLDRAVVLLNEPLDRGVDTLSDLEKEGTVQRFEMVLELIWKTLKDYLEYQGTQVAPATPRSVFKEAFAAGIIEDGQVWIDMFDHRNLLSHTYDAKTFDAAVRALADRYRPAINGTHVWLRERLERE